MSRTTKFMGLAALLLVLTTGGVAAQVDKQQKANTDVVLTADNTLTIDDVFMWDVVAKITQKAKDMDAKLPSSEPLYLVLDSPGGSIDAGIEMIENLSSLNRPVKTVTLFAASMGFQTVQGLGERLITKNGTLMSHKARGGFYGEFPGQIDSRYGYYLKRVNRLDEVAAKRTNGKHDLKSYQALVENEYWCDGADCVKEGFADRVITGSCDYSLGGTKKITLDRFMFRGRAIEIIGTKSNCPLITGIQDYNIYIDGEPLFVKPKDEAPKQEVSVYSYYQEPAKAKDQLDNEQIQELVSRAEKRIQQLQEKVVVKGY